MMRRHKSLTTPNKNTNHKQNRRHLSQVIISTNYELRDAILTRPPPPVDSNSSGSDNAEDDIKKARRERRRRRSRSRRRKSLSSVNSKKKLQSNHDDINPNHNDSSIDILNGNHDQVLKDSLLLAKQHLHQPSTSTTSLRRSLSYNEIYNCSTISLLDDIPTFEPQSTSEHTNKMKSNLLACSITTDSSASFVGTENIKMLHISDDEEHSIVSSVDDSVDNTTSTQQQKQQEGINKDKDNNNSSRTLNTSATTTSNPQPSSPPSSTQPTNSKSSSQIQLNKYTMGLQQATSGLKSAQMAIGKLQTKNIKLEERNEELESENYYLLILLKNLIDENGINGGKGGGGKGSSLEEMLAPLKNKKGISSSSEKGKGKKDSKGKGKGKEEVNGWKRASHWWKDRSNRSSDDNKEDDDEVLVVQGLPLIDNSDRGGANNGGGGSKSSGQSNKSSSYKPGASVRSLKSSNKSSSGASGWWGGNNNRHRRSKSGGEVSEGCGSSWHTSASGKGVGEGTELLDGVPSTLIDKIRNLSVTLSRGSNMAVDSSKQKREKCPEVGQDMDDHPPVPEYVQWNNDRKIDYCSDVSFDGIVDESQQQGNDIGKADEKEEEDKEEEYKKDTNLISYLKKNSETSQSQQQKAADANMEEERQHANSAQYSLNPGDDDTYDPSEYEFSDC